MRTYLGEMLIGELARRTGATPRALRLYEEQGLLAATRTAAGYREYGADAVQRVRTIRDLLTTGFTMANIQAFLPYLDQELPEVFAPPGPDCTDGTVVGAERVAELNERIASLTRLRDSLVQRLPWLG